MIPSYDQLRHYRESIGAPWFFRAFDLNLLVARSGEVGLWDDLVLVAFTDDADRRVVEAYPATGDAWEGEWLNPTHPEGCIYVLDQHVPGGLTLGQFKGRDALRQAKPFRCVRWPKGRNAVPTVRMLEALPDFLGNRGTHIHDRVTGRAPEKPARDDSEGCTVLLYKHHRAALIELVREQARRYGSATVSPTYCKRANL